MLVAGMLSTGDNGWLATRYSAALLWALVYCPKLSITFSEPENSQLQGVIRRKWQALFKDDNSADGCFPARPKGSPQIPQSCVTVLGKGNDHCLRTKPWLGEFGGF